MRFNSLGNSGLLVSELCLGTMTFGEESKRSTPPDHDEEAWDRRATEKNWQILEVIEEIIGDHPGATYSQVALAWLLAQPAVDSVILGVRTMEQMEDNLGVVDLCFAQEELANLDKISAPEKGYPYRFLHIYGSRN